MNTFWKVFIAVLTLGVIVSLVTLFNGSRPVGSENLIGRPLPNFAAPLAGSDLNGDSNVYTPAEAEAKNASAACEVEIAGAFNSCRDLKGQAIVTFWNSTKGECVSEVATLDAFAKAHKSVNTVAVAFDEGETSVRDAVKKQGFTLPVAIDRDGAVAALYSVAGCPTTFFAKDGEITGVKLGVISAAQLKTGLAKPGPTG